MSQDLTAKQLTFVREYVRTLDIKTALKAAGYPGRSGSLGRKMLGQKHIVEAVNDELKRQSLFLEPTKEGILRELMRIAFFDPAKLFSDQGHPLPLSEIDEDTRRCIAGIEFSVEGKGEDAEVIKKYKIIDKHKALENLGRYLAMFTDKMKLDVPTELEKMSDEELRRTAVALAEATGLTVGPSTSTETQH